MRKIVIQQLRDKLKPEFFTGNKTNQRDFGNWENKIETIFSLLTQTRYFETISKEGKQNYDIVYKTPIDEDETRFERSKKPKSDYFKEHNIQKKDGFEFHHIFPISWSENLEQFKLLDSWKNLLYIDGFTHAIISQNRNKYVLLSFIGDNIKLEDKFFESISLEKNNNVLYSPLLQNRLLSHNSNLSVIYFSSDRLDNYSKET
jgi:hypothetical protein